MGVLATGWENRPMADTVVVVEHDCDFRLAGLLHRLVDTA